MLTTSTKRKQLSTAALLLLFGLAAPRFATAAVFVADPTGDADPAFLAELKASLETVAAEAAPDVNGELKSSAVNTDAGVELVVEYVPFIGAEPIRETRIASRASASAQARAMARAAIKPLVAPNNKEATPPTVVAAQEKTVAPPPPPLPVKYNRHKALLMAVLPTGLFPTVGAGIFSLGVLALGDEDGGGTFLTCTVFGSVFAASGLILGPSTGYFWIGRTRHALILAGVRLAAIGVGITFMALYVKTFQWGDGDIEQKSNPGFLALSIIGFTTALVAAFVDAGLVGRAADRVNEQWRKDLNATGASRRSLEVAVAPVAWSNGNGDGTFGLAVSGSF
jgi:hypothetical protein